MKIHEPPMTFKNDASQKMWKMGLTKNQDPYGNAVYRFASEWATRMEQRLTDSPDAKISEIADECSREADTEGITGFMYGCAVSMLADIWVHGEELRRWHNLDVQIGTEGEQANEKGATLNPAIIQVQPKSTS